MDFIDFSTPVDIKPVEFFQEWVKTLSKLDYKMYDGTVQEVTKISRAKSKKGYTLRFNDLFAIWVWNNSPFGLFVKTYVANEKGMIVCKLILKGIDKCSYLIAVDETIDCSITQPDLEKEYYNCIHNKDNKNPV